MPQQTLAVSTQKPNPEALEKISPIRDRSLLRPPNGNFSAGRATTLSPTPIASPPSFAPRTLAHPVMSAVSVPVGSVAHEPLSRPFPYSHESYSPSSSVLARTAALNLDQQQQLQIEQAVHHHMRGSSDPYYMANQPGAVSPLQGYAAPAWSCVLPQQQPGIAMIGGSGSYATQPFFQTPMAQAVPQAAEPNVSPQRCAASAARPANRPFAGDAKQACSRSMSEGSNAREREKSDPVIADGSEDGPA